MRGKKLRYNTRLIRRDLSYSVEEVCALYGLHPNTVWGWVKAGLPTLDSGRPLLIYGNALYYFLENRQARRKIKLNADEFFCLKCRAACLPDAEPVGLSIRNHQTVNLTARCAFCKTKVNKVGSIKNIDEYRRVFKIATVRQEHLSDTSNPSLNCDFNKECKNDPIQP